MILSKGGTKQDAKDVFQDALIIFYQKVKNSQFKLSASISTYLYSVCRFIWKDEMLKSNKKKVADLNNDLSDDERSELDDLVEKESKYKLMEEALTQIGDKCLKLLQLFYYSNMSMKKIASDLEFKTEHVAKNQKYKCLEKAKLKLKQLQTNSY